MIKTGKEYRVFEGKVVGDGAYTRFSYQDSERDKDTGEWRNGNWYTIMTHGSFPSERKSGNKILINRIDSVTFDEYNGNKRVTIWADVELHTKDGATIGSPDENGFQEITDSQDLPF